MSTAAQSRNGSSFAGWFRSLPATRHPDAPLRCRNSDERGAAPGKFCRVASSRFGQPRRQSRAPAGYGFGHGPRYGFRPTVMPRPPAAG
ncbi:PPE family protein, SVP subgroup [Mycobacterium malmoense]|uniref:PPE family protein, SVP subgroup n=1 Tax=Mycobacterium malmoense TaxID=1780 RepID=UPI0009FA076E|nr:hypothetical protein [Mycobacterium malmoense]